MSEPLRTPVRAGGTPELPAEGASPRADPLSSDLPLDLEPVIGWRAWRLGWAMQEPPKGAAHDRVPGWIVYSRDEDHWICWGAMPRTDPDVCPWATASDQFARRVLPEDDGPPHHGSPARGRWPVSAAS